LVNNRNCVPRDQSSAIIIHKYINDLPYGVNPYAKPVIYADHMSVLSVLTI